MELRQDGYGKLLVTDDGRQVPLSAADISDLVMKLPYLASELHLRPQDQFDTDQLQEALEIQGAQVTWPA